MNNDWQHLQSLFHVALSLKIEERPAYLAHECRGDEELLKEVESLIEASEKRADFLEQPALSLGMQVLSLDSTDKLTNQLIGSFKILSLLGKGGMGNVYLAEDTHLGRKVALKFLSGKLADNQWAKRQFTKEAQAVAMLDHSNICTVHGFEEANGYSFIVMQYVEGERLDELIQKGKLELSEVLSLSVQIANALSEAHAHGIIHRDIKPSNLIVTASGQLKVLDFGLAKVIQQQHSRLSIEDVSSNSLQLGFIPGTIAYMSPEQLRGERLDYGTDIFSYGVVLYEMVSGKGPFARDSKAETISTILTSQPPPLRQHAPQVPRELERVVQKCLEKEKNARYQSIAEILVDLEELQSRSKGTARRRWYPNVRVVAAITLLLLLSAVVYSIYVYLNSPRTIAILPIANETGDTSLDYLGDGLAANVINKLTGLSKLRVKPFSQISGYKEQQIDSQKVGRELGVEFLVMGKLTKTKDSLLLDIIMIDTGDGAQIWSNKYSISIEQLYHVEDEVARQLASKSERLSRGNEAKILGTPRPKNPDAYSEYMMGMYFWRLRDKENIGKAIEHFNKAIELEPSYAPAHAGLAECYVLLNTVHYGSMTTQEAMTKAEAAAKEALNIDNTLPEALTALGDVNLKWNLNWPEAEREFLRAIELNYDYAPAHYSYSVLLAITGRFDKATEQGEIASTLDPFSPITNLNYCRTFYFARKYDRASTCFEKLVAEQPEYKYHQYMLGLVYLSRGMYPEATRIFEDLHGKDPSMAGAALGYTYGVTGRKDDALRVLSEMEALRSPKIYISPQEFAIINMGLGDKDKAFSLLKAAAAERFGPTAYIGVDPLFDSLRADPRFTELARSLNLQSQPTP